jgi:hypothetical protein
MSGKPVCPEKSRLVTAYEKATRAHADKLAALQKVMGTISKSDYDDRYRAAEVLQQQAMAAHELLEQHVRTHGC